MRHRAAHAREAYCLARARCRRPSRPLQNPSMRAEPARPSAAFTALAAIALAIVPLVSIPAASVQEPQPAPEQPLFRTRVNVVRVDVSVFNSAGAPITDLRPSDFALTEDDVPQRIDTVQFVELNGQADAGSNESLEIRSPEHAAVEAAKDDVRLFALFLDDYHVDKAPSIVLPLRRALETFVNQLGPRDLVAVMDPLTPLSHLRLTRSRSELLERVRAFEGRRGERFPVRSVLEEAQLQRADWYQVRGAVSLSALTSLATYLGGLREGRKSILFVSQGPLIGGPGDTNYARMEEAIEAANRGNVTINVFDPRPLGSGPFGGAEVLRRLSRETGGRAIVNTNEPENGLRQVIADSSAYYLVGYTPTREIADGKFHRIEVEVKRRGVRVLARRGYWAPRAEELTPAEPPTPPEPGLARAMAPIVGPPDGRIVDTWMGVEPADRGQARLFVTWEPAARRSESQAVRLMVEPLEQNSGDALAPPQVVANATTAGDDSMAAFTLPEGRVVVRLTALDASGDPIDRWTQSIALPEADEGQPVLSTPRVLRARSLFELRALNANPNPVPVASRVFRSTDRVFVEVSLLNGDEAPIAAELLNNRGDPLIDLPLSEAADSRRRVTLPLTSLAPGVYAVRIRAGVGDRESRQLVAFRVER